MLFLKPQGNVHFPIEIYTRLTIIFVLLFILAWEEISHSAERVTEWAHSDPVLKLSLRYTLWSSIHLPGISSICALMLKRDINSSFSARVSN
jgi:hypothetical protein